MMHQRKPGTPYIKSVRSMTRDDLEFLRQKSDRRVIVKLRESHHIVARLLASGLSVGEVAAEVGYTVTRIAVLKNSPAVQDLIARYRDEDTAEWRKSRDQYYESVHAAGRKAWRQINDQLDDADDENPLPLKVLLSVADSSADRVGYHKKSTKENINIDFAARLDAAIARSRSVKVIEHEE